MNYRGPGFLGGLMIWHFTTAPPSPDIKFDLGCALTFTLEAKFEIEAKISFRLDPKKSLISHDSLQCETPKIWSENEGKISEKIEVKRKLSEKMDKNVFFHLKRNWEAK